MSNEGFICSTCGTIGDPVKVTRGSFWIEVVLWLFFILPGLIYSIWRLTSRYKACPQCRNSTMIPFSSPVTQKMLAEQSAPAKPAEKPALKKSSAEIRDLATDYINKISSKR